MQLFHAWVCTGLEEKSTDRRYVSPEGSRLNGFIGRNGGGWLVSGCLIENRDSFGENTGGDAVL